MQEGSNNISAFNRKIKGIEDANVFVRMMRIPKKSVKFATKIKKEQDRIQRFIDSREMVGN